MNTSGCGCRTIPLNLPWLLDLNIKVGDNVEAFGQVEDYRGLSKSFSQLSFGLVYVFMGPPAGLRKLVI